MSSRTGVWVRAAGVVVALVGAAVVVNIVRHGSYNGNIIETVFTAVGVAILVAVGSTPIVAVVCFLKGRSMEGWMAALTLPAIAAAFGAGRFWIQNQDLDGFEGIGPALLVFVWIVGLGGMLTAVGWSGALKFARPESTWAHRWYDQAKTAAAIANDPMRMGNVDPSPGDWPSGD